jgi:multiple sugar transport system permease protein
MLLMLTVLALGGPIAGAAEDEPVRLRCWELPGPDKLSAAGRADLAVFEAFRKAHPKVVFEQAAGLELPGPAGTAGLIMSIAGGTAPDVMYVNFQRTRDFVQRGFLEPLDAYIREDITADEALRQGVFDPDIMYRDELEERLLPQVREVVHARGPDGKKHFYALPYSNLAICLLYNKTLFRKAGLDPLLDYPKTWDDFYEVAQKLTDSRLGRYGFVAYTGPGASWVAYTFMVSMGTRAMCQIPETGEWRATFDDEGMASAVDFYLKLLQAPWRNPRTGVIEKGVAYFDRDVTLKWDRGEIGMQFGYLADEMLMGFSLPGSGSINPDELGFAPVPTSPAGLQASELNCQMMGLFAGTKDPRVRLAAWRYIRFYNGPAARRIRALVYVENGYGNMILPQKLKAYGLSEYGGAFPALWEEAYRTSFQNGVPEPYGPGCQQIYHYMSRPFEKARTDKIGENPDREARLQRIRAITAEAVREANIKMIGKVPDREMRVRRWVATVLATAILAAFVALFVCVWRLFTPGAGNAPPAATRALRQCRIAYLLLAPAVLGVVLFHYLPLLRGTGMAFLEYNVMGPSRFVGIDNFANVLYDGLFWLSMWRALQYSLLYLLLVFVPPILLAIILSEIPVGKSLFRVIFYLPAVTAGMVALLMWKLFFDPSAAGIANRLLAALGIPAQGWLQDKELAMLALMIPQAWASLGPGCLIYLAALKTVPDDLYEAAAIDGAGFFARVRRVMLPTIRPLILIQLIFALIASFQSADLVLIMTGGGPDYATHVVGMEIFLKSYVFLEFGVATAMGWILAFALLGLTVLQMTRLSRVTFKAAGQS